MATSPAPVKSTLHNFSPTFFKWGSKSPHQHRSHRSPSTPDRPPPEERESGNGKAAEVEVEPEAEVEEEKSWNLRPRRTTPAFTTSKVSSTEAAQNLPKSMRLRGFDSQAGGRGGAGERKEKRKFWIALSREEIEEDIYAFTGSKPSRRPKRRPRNVQKQLDNVFPGLWLVGLSAETCRTLDVPPNN